MKLSDWESLYSTVVSQIVRRMDNETLSFYSDNVQDWVDALLSLGKFEEELFDKYYKPETQHICIRYRTWTSLCRKYMRTARKENKKKSAQIIFNLWGLAAYCFPRTKHIKEPQEYLRPITQEELDFALANLIPGDSVNIEWYNRDSKVLTYRNLNAVVDNRFGQAHILDDDGTLLDFDLIWDWYYPIDRYLDLEKGWKKD